MSQPPPDVQRQRRIRSLYLLLLFAYISLILYGSLFSLQYATGSQGAVQDLRLLAWPRYNPKTDIAANLLIYLPVGYLAFRLAHMRFGVFAAALVAIALGAGLSLILESLQSLLPSRVSSILDLIFNTASTVIGAVLGLTIRRGSDLYDVLERVRSGLFRGGAINELGMTVLILWLVSQLFPFMPVLNLDQLSHSLQPLVDALQHRQLSKGYLIPVYMLNIIVLGSVLRAVQHQHRRMLLLGLLVAFALGAKVLIVRSQLSPEALIGAGGGIILVWMLEQWRHLTPMTGVIAMLSSLLINKSSGFTGFTATAGNFTWVPFTGYSNYMSAFSDILNGLWPYWTLAYFCIALRQGYDRNLAVNGAVLVLVVAVTLEIMQLFQSNREAELTDILTAVTGWLLAWAIYLIRRQSQRESVSGQAS